MNQKTYHNLAWIPLFLLGLGAVGLGVNWLMHPEPWLLDQPPNEASINGPKTGTIKKSISYNFLSTDPEGHDIYYSIDWGDGNYMPYTGPYSSGEEVTFSHAWSDPDQYTIKVKAKDEYEGVSPQSSFKVQISKNRASLNLGFLQLFENLINRHTSIIELLIALIKM